MRERVMGAWGPGIFDNDDALDLVDNLCAGRDLGIAHDILCKVANSGRPEFDVDMYGDISLAMAEVVAAAGGLPSPDLPKTVRAWLDSRQVKPDQQLVLCALRAVGRVIPHLQATNEYWSTPEHFTTLPAWKQNCFGEDVRLALDLQDRLNQLALRS